MAPGRRKSPLRVSLGYLEMEIMPIVWEMGKATVRDVFEKLYYSRRLAYTTVLTVMKRLVDKGMLRVDSTTIPFVYSPAVASQELATALVDEVIDRLLGGTSAPLVLHYLEHGKISAKEKSRFISLLGDQEKG